jgi:thioesterase domain-containing protein
MTSLEAADGDPAPVTTADPRSTEGPDTVRLERLRAGRADEILFIVPGLEGVLDELAHLTAAFTGPQQVYAVAPRLEAAELQPAGMEDVARQILAAIRRVQPSGPYLLGGYSFGGVVALEMAQQLRSSGDTVAGLFLIDAVYDERYWPRGSWLRAIVRRAGRQLSTIVRMPPAKAFGELRRRGVRLIQRVMRRRVDAPDRLTWDANGERTALARAHTAMSAYCPRFYDGAITLIGPSVDRHFGCDTTRLWAGYAQRLDIWRVDGDHLTLMHEPAAAARVARVIDHRLATRRADWGGVRPMPGFERPMILTTMRWFSAARLTHALTEAGFSVSACRPKGHPLDLVDGLASAWPMHRMWRARSLATAIRHGKPDLVLPDDERALALLRRLHTRTQSDPEIAAVIARSLGNIEDWPLMASRTALAAEARNLNIPAPLTRRIGTAVELSSWVAEQSLPVVLKTDGSWGGRGVAIVRQASHLNHAWRTISGPPGLPRALKRLLVDLETRPITAWVTRTRPIVNAQQLVEGREAIATVACVDGVVQTLVCLEVVASSIPRGPASAVRIIDHPGMASAARSLVNRLGLTGFCGFDFIITASGEAQLLELNARVTPTCYLLVEGDYQRARTIALFPSDRLSPSEPASAEWGELDVPERAPYLVWRGERIRQRNHRPTARIARSLKRKLMATN